MTYDARLSVHAWPRALAIGALAALAACGGGGDTQPAAAAPAAATAPAPAPSAGGSGALATGTCDLPGFTADMLARVNQFRAAGASCGSHGVFGPATGLAWSAALSQAADAHSRDMVANNFFSHTGSDGSSAGQRITAAGYRWSAYGENIAAGQATVAEVVDGWMASDGHCANIMNAAFVDIGVVCLPGNTSTSYRSYWTMELGKSR